MSHSIPLPYQLFFLYLEPISTLIGAYFAHFDQAVYTYLTAEPYTTPSTQLLTTVSSTDSVILSQLANLYLLFALNEGLVLRATNDKRVWRTLLFGLLVADLGHLWSCRAASPDWSLYWQAWRWNRMYWGNLGFVYLGATMRVCFLMGVGLGRDRKGRVD